MKLELSGRIGDFNIDNDCWMVVEIGNREQRHLSIQVGEERVLNRPTLAESFPAVGTMIGKTVKVTLEWDENERLPGQS